MRFKEFINEGWIETSTTEYLKKYLQDVKGIRQKTKLAIEAELRKRQSDKFNSNQNSINSEGSYLDNKKIPKENQLVYFLYGFNNEIKKGKIIKITNIDNKGLANTYMEIEGGYHTSIDRIYDHKPQKIKIKDEYGEVTVWR